MGVVGYEPRDRWRGVYTNRSKISFRSIRDGSSNTLMFGEAGGWKPQPDFFYSWMGCGAMPTAWGLKQFASDGWTQFSSYHPGVVQFCLADGSVKGISRQIDRDDAFIPLSSIEDGKTNRAKGPNNAHNLLYSAQSALDRVAPRMWWRGRFG